MILGCTSDVLEPEGPDFGDTLDAFEYQTSSLGRCVVCFGTLRPDFGGTLDVEGDAVPGVHLRKYVNDS